MKKFLALLGTLTLSLALCSALCACGGGEGTKSSKSNNDSSSSSDNSSSKSDDSSATQTSADKTTSIKPAFDITGDWKAAMDNHDLGTIHFQMKPDGDFTGSLNVLSTSAGTLEGSLSGYNAEWVMRYQALSYLGSVTFDESQHRGVGHLVDGKGNTHELVLTR